MTQTDTVTHSLLASLDLTNLETDCTTEDVNMLTDAASTRYGPVAGVCVWPKFVRKASSSLMRTGIKVVTVVNFPGGDFPASQVIAETKDAVAQGAEEIDVVIPWKMMLEGHPENVSARVARVKAAADGAPVKAIIESGMLGKEDAIRLATRGAIDGGADFIKTSTGKVPVNATPDAARAILEEIKASGKPIGFKASGGIRTIAAAREYFDLAETIMGKGWATPQHFRIGGSVLLDVLLEELKE